MISDRARRSAVDGQRRTRLRRTAICPRLTGNLSDAPERPAIAGWKSEPMDANRFDDLIRVLPFTSRRGLLAGLAGGMLAAVTRSPRQPAAQKRKKRKKLQFNAFGCVDVGGACRGNGANCCSGICAGSKPKQGGRDRSRCAAHDQSTCVAGQTDEFCGGIEFTCTTTAGVTIGACITTTGNAPYCFSDGDCFPCKKDADCIGVCGPQAACAVCNAAECAPVGGTACVGIEQCNFPPAGAA
jgi:hypothetical protein